jgi:predicted dehydrogenase
MSIIRWGVYGPGNIANRFAEAINSVKTGKIVAVAGRTRKRAADFAAKHHVDHVYDNLHDMSASLDVDAIYIATTHNVHCSATCICLAAGKAVLCEKPLAMNSQEVSQMVHAARQNKTFLMEALWTRFLPVWKRVKKLVEQGAIGTPQLVHGNFCISSTFDPKGRMLNKELAGGALLDLGIYPISMAQMILPGPVESIQATGVIGTTGVDTLTAVTLRFSQGGIAQLCAGLTARANNAFTIAGDQGYIQIEEPFWGGTHLRLVVKNAEDTEEHHPLRCNGFEEQIEDVHRCIMAGAIESTTMAHRDSLAIATIMDTVRQQIGLRYVADDQPCEPCA